MTSLLLYGLLVAAYTPPAVDALAAYVGQPVLAVEFDAPRDEDVRELVELVEIEPGYLLEAEAIRTALKRLYALGRFADVAVYASRRTGTVTLRFVVTALTRLGELDVEGLELANIDALREALRIRSGDEIDSRTPERLRARAEQHLMRSGFPSARVTVDVVADDKASQHDYVLRVVEGAPVRVRSIQFAGQPATSAAVLSTELTLAVGDILDTQALERERERLRLAYRRRGFLGVELDPPLLAIQDQQADITFVVRAGRRIALHFRGNELFTDAALRSLMPAQDGPVRQATIDRLARTIEQEYRRAGRFAARVTVRAFKDGGENAVRYVLDIDEARPVRVRTIEIAGASAFANDLLERQIRAVVAYDASSQGVLQSLSVPTRCQLATLEVSSAAEPDCPAEWVRPPERWLPEAYANALGQLESIYKNLGYLEARLGPAAPRFEGDTVDVSVPIVEGPQTFIQTLAFRGNQAFESGDLLTTAYEATANRDMQAPIQPGSPYSATGVEDVRIALVRRYRDQGYLYARVFADARVKPGESWAEVAYRIEEGPQVRIQRVLIRGNRFTRESLIKSRIQLAPGDVYRLDQALTDQRAIGALGVFSSVRVKLIDEERPAELKDLVAEVVERDRQPVEIAPGISTADGPRIQASYSHINVLGTASVFTLSLKLNRQVFFDLYGQAAQTIRERYDELSALEQLERVVRAGIRSPRFVALPFEPSARFDLVHERTNAIAYSLDSLTAIFGVDFFPTERLTVSLEPQASITDLECPKDANGVIVDCLGEVRDLRPDRPALSRGTRQMVKFGPSVTYDLRDDPFNPTRGIYAFARAFYAVGSLRAGAEDTPVPIALANLEGAVSSYVSLGPVVLALSLRGGTIDAIQDEVPIDERFFLGGRDSLRGFVERNLIPEDACFAPEESETVLPRGCGVFIQDDPPLSPGGKNFALLKSELRVPLSERFSFALFADVGNLWFERPDAEAMTLRLATGAGLRYATPVGPLAVDLGVNPFLRSDYAEPPVQLHFSVGVF